jgi:hypothetical protein
MENLSFAEGRLTFHFDALHWQVRKYDDHSYFQGFSGVGLKGVDFVAILEDDLLVLLEVKNYTWKGTSFREKDVRLTLQQPELIEGTVIQKMEDTLAGLRAIHIHYQRKAARSWRWLDRFRKKDPEQLFWDRATDLMEEGKLLCLLWMEVEEEYSAFAKNVSQQLAMPEVDGQFAVQVANHKDYPFASRWSVENGAF